MNKQSFALLLMDDRAQAPMRAEHGLSLLLSWRGRRVLMDTGASPLLLENAKALGEPLSELDYVVLSHGHYDHAGGLGAVFAEPGHPVLVCHPAATQPRYKVQDSESRYIGIPGSAARLMERLPESRLRWVQGGMELAPGLGVISDIKCTRDFEEHKGPFFLDPEGRRPDPIQDDMALWLEDDEGLHLFLGCAHAGVISTVEAMKALHPDKKILSITGGLHLKDADDARVSATIQEIKALDLERLTPCHCTGSAVIARLREELGSILQPAAVGRRIPLH